MAKFTYWGIIIPVGSHFVVARFYLTKKEKKKKRKKLFLDVM